MVVGKEVPGRAVRAIVFAHGAPLAFGEVGSPAPPVSGTLNGFLQSTFFLCHSVMPSLCCAVCLFDATVRKKMPDLFGDELHNMAVRVAHQHALRKPKGGFWKGHQTCGHQGEDTATHR